MEHFAFPFLKLNGNVRGAASLPKKPMHNSRVNRKSFRDVRVNVSGSLWGSPLGDIQGMFGKGVGGEKRKCLLHFFADDNANDRWNAGNKSEIRPYI
ncbi:hypothetical protein TNIN_418771 [Trichonephila inaurata madagascariensis]|uniref:Uncharacterized protein n=1 Tax=Trichonephila inaurata madagascariensis TaxID=2747483 RepID=A0A8X6IX71_9ARAC|nr:hypothetical protein TNIN_418771 [Trichonephila inaurata madagascariensis]